MQVMDSLRKAIEADPRTQKEIAAAAKINPVNLSQFKSGGALTIDSLCRLADALGKEITIADRRKKK